MGPDLPGSHKLVLSTCFRLGDYLRTFAVVGHPFTVDSAPEGETRPSERPRHRKRGEETLRVRTGGSGV